MQIGVYTVLSLSLSKKRERCQLRFSHRHSIRHVYGFSGQSCAQTFASFNPFTGNKLFRPKVSKITITFKNELDRKSKSELLGFGFGYKFVLYQPSSHSLPANGNDRKTRVNIRLGCQVKEWLEFRQNPCERRYKYVRSLIHRTSALKGNNDKRDTSARGLSAYIIIEEQRKKISTQSISEK